MMLTLVLVLVFSLFIFSVAVPVTRRVWVFHLYSLKYLLLTAAEKLGLRRLFARVAGRRHIPLTRPRALRLFSEDMGPTFVKFGQLIGSSSGLFPDAYVREFQHCLDRVRPLDFDIVRQTIADELGAEGRRRLINVGIKPLASASIAQVHTAELVDGSAVVVKVQRPGIAGRVDADLKIMRILARILTALKPALKLANPIGILEDLAATLREEIDFRQEAANLDRFNEIMRELGYADVRAPGPHWELITRKVLVMERFDGIRVDDVDAIEADADLDPEQMLVKGLRAWFQCVIFYGFFHGDVHAGNLMFLNNHDIGFIDFGIVGRFDDRERLLVTDYIVAFAVGDYKTLAKTIVAMGGVGSDADLEGFATSLKEAYEPIRTSDLGDLNIAAMIPKVNEVARRHGMTMPREFILIMKQLLYFDRYAKLLAPKLNIFTDSRLIMSLLSDIQSARASATKPA